MRLMLGKHGTPSLLVSVQNLKDDSEFNPNLFKFHVVNGCWEGEFNNGFITILGAPSGDYSSLDTREILTDNQDRLRGDYQTVFNNFANPSYVAPLPKRVEYPASWDDDIPF